VAIANPWVACGIVFLLAFFASYMAALSWADLTYVLPATSVAYIVVALAGRFIFHETISPSRWLGIALITAGVGFVAGGPSHTTHHNQQSSAPSEALSQEAQSCRSSTTGQRWGRSCTRIPQSMCLFRS